MLERKDKVMGVEINPRAAVGCEDLSGVMLEQQPSPTEAGTKQEHQSESAVGSFSHALGMQSRTYGIGVSVLCSPGRGEALTQLVLLLRLRLLQQLLHWLGPAGRQ